MRPTARHIVFIALIALLWGGSFLAIRISVGSFPPFAAAALRVVIATVVMRLCMSWQGAEHPLEGTVRLHLLGIGFFTLGFPWALLFWGEQFVTPAMGAIINSTTPIFTVLAAALFTRRETLRWNKLMGVAAGLAGVVLIFGPKVGAGAADDIKGMAAIALMAVCYAIGIVWLKSIAHRVRAAPAFYHQGLGALMFLVPLALVVEGGAIAAAPWSSHSGWAALIYLGVASTAAAQLMFFVVLRDLGAVKAAAITYLIPLAAIALDWAVFRTLPAAAALGGAMLILTGVRLIHLRVTIADEELADAAA